MKLLTAKSFFFAVICCLLPAQVIALGQQTSPAAVSPAPQTELEKREEAFQIVWQTVNDLFYDPKFGGVDWLNARQRYQPRVAAVKDNAEFHQLLQQMLNELHQSHFMVVPREAIPKIRVSEDPDKAPSSDSEEAPEDDPFDDLSYKLADRLLTGIGIDLRVLNGTAVVTRVEPGSAAARAGLRPGFVIKKVGGRSLDNVIAEIEKHPLWGELVRAELPVLLVAGFINGENSSSVRLGYLDGRNHLRTISVRRERLKGQMSTAIGNLPSMYTEFEAKRLRGGVGYIRFNAFVPPLMEKLCGALRSMKNAPGIILDLRGNQGGLLGMVSGLTGLLENTPTFMGTLKTRGGMLPLAAMPQASPYTGPLVIIVDGSTQSAGEMFASGLQEIDRAVIVGEKTAGNTLPSAIKKLPTNAIFQYAFANYETRSGVRLEGLGVVPNFTVSLSRKNLLRGNDPQLNAALRHINENIALKTKPVELIAEVPSAPAPAPPPTRISVANGPPPVRATAPRAAVETVTPNLPSVDLILEKYLAVSGGKEAFDRITSRVSTGAVELTALGMKGTVEIVEESPNKSSMIINAPGLGIMQRTFDGAHGWLQDPLQGFIRFTGVAGQMAKDNAVFNRQWQLADLKAAAVLIGQDKVDGKDVYVVRVGFEKWYFSTENGLLLRRGNTYYDDYREVDGMNLPFKIREEAFAGAAAIYLLADIKHNIKIDESKFTAYPSCFTKP